MAICSTAITQEFKAVILYSMFTMVPDYVALCLKTLSPQKTDCVSITQPLSFLSVSVIFCSKINIVFWYILTSYLEERYQFVRSPFVADQRACA